MLKVFFATLKPALFSVSSSLCYLLNSKLVANKVHEYVPGDQKAQILDIGCGDGLVAEALSARVSMQIMRPSL